MLKSAFTTKDDATDLTTIPDADLIWDLGSKLYQCVDAWKRAEPQDRSRGEACIESIQKHKLIPLHIRYIRTRVTRIKSVEEWALCLFSNYFELLKLDLIQGPGLKALNDLLLEHEYVRFLVAAYQANRVGRSDAEITWEMPVSILKVLRVALAAVDFDVMRQQQRQSRSIDHVPRGLRALQSKDMQDFLLQQLSLAMRLVLPPGQAPPGALANFSKEVAGKL
jgi:hypothetical protein